MLLYYSIITDKTVKKKQYCLANWTWEFPPKTGFLFKKPGWAVFFLKKTGFLTTMPLNASFQPFPFRQHFLAIVISSILVYLDSGWLFKWRCLIYNLTFFFCVIILTYPVYLPDSRQLQTNHKQEFLRDEKITYAMMKIKNLDEK